MRLKYLLAALLLGLPSSRLSAQNRYDLAQFWSETGLYLGQPARWRGKDWLTAGLVGAGALEVRQYDNSIKRAAQKRHKNANTAVVQVGEQWGGFFVTPLLGGALLTQGWLAGNESTKRTGFEIIQAAAYAETASMVLKTAIGRARPGTNKGPGAARAFSFFRSSYNSFPAGHVDAAFSLSTVLSRRTGSPLLKTLAFVPAGLTAASRIYKNEHWASDCFLGAAIGYFTADWVMDLHERKAGSAAAGVRPFFSGETAGVAVSF